MFSIDQVVESIKSDVVAMVVEGVVPADCADFSELHDYCDANVLGLQEEVYNQINANYDSENDPNDEVYDGLLAQVHAIVEPAQNRVNQWIKSGALKSV